MAGLTILIVDDAAFIRDLVKRAVRSLYPGCQLHEATNGRKALALLNGNAIDVVLCDWEMPEMSGLEVLQWMRADLRYQKTPFMMITSRGDRSHVIEAAQSGVSDYIGKPFSREAFVAKLSKMIFKHLQIRPDSRDPGSPVSGDRSGAAVLLGGQAGGARTNNSPPATPGEASNPDSRQQPTRTTTPENTRLGARKASAIVRFASGEEAQMAISDLNLQEISGVFRRKGMAVPALLDSVAVDIYGAGEEILARINGFIRLLHAQETNPEADSIQIRIRFIDDDPDKMDALTRFIAQFRNRK